jgi:hypothetical protein
MAERLAETAQPSEDAWDLPTHVAYVRRHGTGVPTLGLVIYDVST